MLRLKTLAQIVYEIRAADPDSAVGVSFLTALVEENELSHTFRGNRLVVDVEAVAPALNRMLGFEETKELPQIRTIRGAVAELKRSRPEIGIGEKVIRRAVNDGRIASIGISSIWAAPTGLPLMVCERTQTALKMAMYFVLVSAVWF